MIKMSKMKKIFFLMSAVMIFMSAAALKASAYTASDYNNYMPGSSIYPTYEYYGSNDFYGYDDFGHNAFYDFSYKMPIILGPYPRQYIWHPDGDDNPYTDYYFDDFHGYDSFIGYKDLDIYYPNGAIEVIRNPDSRNLPAIDNPEGYKTFGSHVYGYIPGPGGTCLMYKKHYGDDHEWGIQTYNYDYGYNYYASSLAYRITPPTCPSCQQKSICELTHNCG